MASNSGWISLQSGRRWRPFQGMGLFRGKEYLVFIHFASVRENELANFRFNKCAFTLSLFSFNFLSFTLRQNVDMMSTL